MSIYSRTTVMSTLLGAALFIGPVVAMAADDVPTAASPAAPMPASMAPAATVAGAPTAGASEASRETVEQRIASLHASLDITPAEETDWKGVTKAMRDSASVMAKLVADKSGRGSAHMTALDDLENYEKFAQAHAEGLKKLTLSFARLYRSMPDAQKKVADDVFQNFSHGKPASHS